MYMCVCSIIVLIMPYKTIAQSAEAVECISVEG